ATEIVSNTPTLRIVQRARRRPRRSRAIGYRFFRLSVVDHRPTGLPAAIRGREERRHGLERSCKFLAIPRETEADVTFAVCAEVDARHAADPSFGDQVLRHRPRKRLAALAGRRTPAQIDAQEGVERTLRRVAGENVAGLLADAAVEEIAARLQLLA